MRKRAALYLRVSTETQSVENQRIALQSVSDRAGWQVVEVYIDKGVSGARLRKDRPAFDRMLQDAARRRFDIVASWSVDRLGRSLPDLLAFLSEIHSLGIDLVLVQQGVDTSTPSGKAMFGMMGVYAEFERSMIRERVVLGIARARSQGKLLGRPRLPGATIDSIQTALRGQDASFRQIAADHGVGLGTVQRVSAAMTKAEGADFSLKPAA